MQVCKSLGVFVFSVLTLFQVFGGQVFVSTGAKVMSRGTQDGNFITISN